MFDLELAVNRDWVMDGLEHGKPSLLERQNAPTKCLVVVDEVEVVESVLQQVMHPPAERHGFAECADAMSHGLREIGKALDLPEGRHAAWVGVVPDIQAGEFVQLDVIVDLGIRVTTEDFDVMPKVGERTSDVPGVDTLAAAMFLASVGEQCDP